MSSSKRGRGFYRTWLFLLALPLCLSLLPLHSSAAAAVQPNPTTPHSSFGGRPASAGPSAPEVSPAAGPAALYRAHIPIVSGPRREPPPTTDQNIDAAVAAGTLDSETGLLFKVYGAFGDPRLPPQFRGDDSLVVDSHALNRVQSSWPTLSASTREALRPFLTPPIFQGSWYDLRYNTNSPPADATAAEPYPICSDVDYAKWASDTGRVAHVRIWWPRGQVAMADVARAYLAQMDSEIWPHLTGLMGQPLEDSASSCGGDDSRLDIYLAPVARSAEISLEPPGCKKTPGYIVLNPSAPFDTLAHEFMHAIQDSFNTATGCVYGTDNAWLCEATAQWAQDYVYPSTNREHYTAAWYLDDPALKLSLKNDQHEYGAYIFAQFLARSGSPTLIRTIWDNLTKTNALAAIDQAVSGGLEKAWPRFVSYAWNRAPYDYFKQWDGLTTAAAETTVEVNLGGAGLKEFVAGPAELPNLSASYYHFKFSDPAVRSVAFYNGWSYKVVKRDAGYGAGTAYFADAATAEQKKGASVQAYVKVNGTWRFEDDWTNRGVVVYCLDKQDERVQELVVLYGNSAFSPDGYMLKPAGQRPQLVASNMGCYKWTGSLVMEQKEGASSGCVDITWRFDVPDLVWERYDSGTSTGPSFAYVLKRGTLHWSITDGPCGCGGDTHGSGSIALVPIHGAAYLVSGNFVLSGGLYRRMSTSSADTTWINYTDCGEPRPAPLPFNWGVITTNGPTLTADGLLKGSYDLGLEDSPVWTWDMKPEIE